MILVIFDLETTGLDRTKDQIIQFSGLKIDTTNHSILDSKNLYIQPFVYKMLQDHLLLHKQTLKQNNLKNNQEV